MKMNETLQCIADRFSCREFTGQAPTREELEMIAQAAVQAPSAMNRQPWRIIVVTDKDLIDEMEAEASARLKEQNEEGWQRIQSRGGHLFYHAQALVVVLADKEVPGAPLDCGILCENMVIAAASLQLHSLICGLAAFAFTGEKGEAFKKRLGVPGGYELSITVLLGHAAGPGQPHEPDLSKISYIG